MKFRFLAFCLLASSLAGWLALPAQAQDNAPTACCRCQFRDSGKRFCLSNIVNDLPGDQTFCADFIDKSQHLQVIKNTGNVDWNNITCDMGLTPDQCQKSTGDNAQAVFCTIDPISMANVNTAIEQFQQKYAIDQSIKNDIVAPTLGVPIPGLQFSKPSRSGSDIVIPFLGQYISAMYRYAIAISVIAATIMVVYGGFRYLIGSAAGDVKRGKTIIVDAIAGLVITLGAFLILNTINPATLNLSAVRVPFIFPIPDQDDTKSTETSGDVQTTPAAAPNQTVKCTAPGLVCHTADDCKKICALPDDQRPACSPNVADPTSVVVIQAVDGLQNPRQVKALPEVGKRLQNAAQIAQQMNKNYSIQVTSGYRPLADQINQACKLLDQNRAGDLGAAVAWPGGSNHGAGIAVDVKLLDGSTPLTCSGCYTGSQSQNDSSWQKGAALLAKIMAQAGFKRYGKEIWHFELDDQGTSSCRCKGDACPFPPSC